MGVSLGGQTLEVPTPSPGIHRSPVLAETGGQPVTADPQALVPAPGPWP